MNLSIRKNQSRSDPQTRVLVNVLSEGSRHPTRYAKSETASQYSLGQQRPIWILAVCAQNHVFEHTDENDDLFFETCWQSVLFE